MAQTIRNLPVIHEAQFLSLGREDPLKKRMATHFCILAGRIPRTIPRTGSSSPGGSKGPLPLLLLGKASLHLTQNSILGSTTFCFFPLPFKHRLF